MMEIGETKSAIDSNMVVVQMKNGKPTSKVIGVSSHVSSYGHNNIFQISHEWVL